MNHTLIEKGTKKYILISPGERLIQTESDGLDLVSLCARYQTDLLCIHSDALSDDFFNLRTGLAGAILQKLSLYRLRTAVILSEDRIKGKFREFLTESNQGNVFRSFTNPADAENWLFTDE